jgi:hypothetical protein
MTLKFTLPNKELFSSKIFLFYGCFLVFLLSLLCRSMVDIGPDTGIYLDLGRKVYLGEKYYYHFFESNFPFSFYFYALQYFISLKTAINAIILSEIFINILALISLYFSAKILEKTTIYENKLLFNLIVISYFCGFFLRIGSLQIGEFGTKTSLVLLFFYPYLSFSFQRKTAFSKNELIARGLLMGAIPCFKIHYLILILPIEIYNFCKNRNYKFFLQLDKLVMTLTGSLALLVMIKCDLEYFEFIPSMWKFIYAPYGDVKVFFANFSQIFAFIMQFALIFVIFARQKFDENDKILTIVFLSASLLIILENIYTIDQQAVFFACVSVVFAKFIFNLFAKNKEILRENIFIISCLIFLPIFDLELLPASLLGLGGVVNIWYFAAIYFFFKKVFSLKEFLIFYFPAILIATLSAFFMGPYGYVWVNLFLFLGFLFLLEKKAAKKSFNILSVFAIFTAISILFYGYVSSFVQVATKENQYTSPNEISDIIFHYSKKYAKEKDEYFLMSSILNTHQFPMLNYLEKPNKSRFHIAVLQASNAKAQSHLMFDLKDEKQLFTLDYLFEDVRRAIKDENLKIIFFNNSNYNLHKDNRCIISNLEYYLLDPVFRKNFLQNFTFANHVITTKKLRNVVNIFLKKDDILGKLQPNKERINYDYEIYVRK